MPRVIGTPPVYKFDQKVSKNVDCVICLTTFDWKRNLCYGTKSCIHKVCYTCLYTYLYQVVKNAIQYKSLDLIPCPGGDCQESFEAHQLLNEVFVSKKEIDKWWDLAISSRAYIKNKVSKLIAYKRSLD